MNIIVSGWPGVGQSTLAIIIAKTLNYKLLQGSSTFRYIGSLINLENTGEDRIKADELLEPHWGPIFEKYMQWIANSKENIVSETDISGFFTKDNKNVYSIFLKASEDVRKERLIKDGRPKDVDYIQQRDQSLARAYKDLFGVDFLNLPVIEENYSRVIENENLTIEQELKIIYLDLFNIGAINGLELQTLNENAKAEEDFFWKNGKGANLELIKLKGNLPTPVEIIQDIKKVFPEDIQTLPKELKEIVLNL
jgi:cytidylate kinase